MKDSNSFEPSGSNPEAFFDQETFRLTRGPGAQLRSTSTVKVNRTPRGIFLTAISKGGGAPSTPTNIAIKYFKTMFANYFITTDGTRVAKPYKLRNSTVKELTPDGITYTMTYQGAAAGSIAYIARNKSGGNLPAAGENQRVSPVYCATPADEVLCLQIATTVVSEAADHGVPTGTAIGWIGWIYGARYIISWDLL